MTCIACGGKVRRDEAVWLVPGWPNPWKVQTSVPFHPKCAPRRKWPDERRAEILEILTRDRTPACPKCGRRVFCGSHVCVPGVPDIMDIAEQVLGDQDD